VAVTETCAIAGEAANAHPISAQTSATEKPLDRISRLMNLPSAKLQIANPHQQASPASVGTTPRQ
jgi:hypothetical protein